MTKTPATIQLDPLTRERQWLWEDIPVLELKLTVPHCTVEDSRTRRINRYYEHFLQSCEHYAHQLLFPAASEAFAAAVSENRCPPPWHFYGGFFTHLLCDRIWSLCLETEESTDSAPYRRRISDTWDLQSGYPMVLAEFFPSDPFYRRRLQQQAKEALHQQPPQDAILHESWSRRISSAWKRENFYLSEAGLHWYYPMYALGGPNLEIPTFFLPWEEGKNPRLPAGLSLDKDKAAVLS